MVLFLQK